MEYNLSKRYFLDKSENIMGLDLSLRGTGICVLNPEGKVIHSEVIKYKKRSIKKIPSHQLLFIVNREVPKTFIEINDSNNQIDEMKRLIVIQQRIKKVIDMYNISKVCLEGYSMASKGLVFDIGELGGLVKVMLYSLNIHVNNTLFIVSPPSLKMYTSGKGNAGKFEMIDAVNKLYKMEFKPEEDNQADACALANLLFTLGPKMTRFYSTKEGSTKFKKDILKRK